MRLVCKRCHGPVTDLTIVCRLCTKWKATNLIISPDPEIADDPITIALETVAITKREIGRLEKETERLMRLQAKMPDAERKYPTNLSDSLSRLTGAVTTTLKLITSIQKAGAAASYSLTDDEKLEVLGQWMAGLTHEYRVNLLGDVVRLLTPEARAELMAINSPDELPNKGVDGEEVD